MNTKEYLNKILEKEFLSNDSDEIKAIWKERENVESILRNFFKNSDPTIKYGGSKAKGTMIRSNYDLDIACYFDRDDNEAGETLEEIFNNAKKALEEHYLVKPKTSALRLEGKYENNRGVYFHIDVVPGRYIEEGNECDDVFIYQNLAEKCRLKTNLKTHIDFIKKSGLQDVIKLAKLWKKRNGLQLRTFVLEMLVVEILKDCDKENVEDCLIRFWDKLKNDIYNISIYDPANPNGNDLSPFFDSVIKAMLSNAAGNSFLQVEFNNWEGIFGSVEQVSNAAKAASISSIKKDNPQFRPYSGY